jgi:hypothetical protein
LMCCEENNWLDFHSLAPINQLIFYHVNTIIDLCCFHCRHLKWESSVAFLFLITLPNM